MSDETAESIILESAVYWRLRAKLLEHQSLVDRLQRQMQSSEAALNALFAAAGLDPNTVYRLKDDDCSASVERG